MINRNTKNIILLSLIVVYTIVYKLVIFPNFMKISSIISASFFVILLAIAIKFLGYRKFKPCYNSRNIFIVTILFLILAFIIMYALGFTTGFLKNSYSREILSLIDNILAPIVLIVLTEIFRYVIIRANKDKKYFIVLFVLAISLFEILVSVRTFKFNNFSLFFSSFAGVILPIIIKNIVLSYITYYAGFKAPIIYRLVMDIYVFIVPIIPDLGDYLNSLILVSLPMLIYICSSQMIDDKVEKVDYSYVKKNFSLIDISATIILVILACLVSGFFPLYMIGIGSESMNPVLKKGDAIVLKKVNTSEILKKGDIIAYKKDNKVVIHRIEEITKSNGNIVYVTKGDANKTVDSKVVELEQVEGIVKFKISYIAYPTVWLGELLGN